jgi:hypothetical protein
VRLNLLLAASLLLCKTTFGQQRKQVDREFSNKIANIQFSYMMGFPAADLAARFGTIHNVGFGGLYKAKQNWVAGFEVCYQFGSDVKDVMLGNLTNSSGYISNTGGFDASYSITQRGVNGFVKGGVVLPFSNNRNSGILLLAGAGMLSHKVNITHTKNDIPTLTEELTKGYDRLSWGPAITAFAGYHFQSRNRLVNFYIGIDYMQAFTRNRRGYNYDTQMADHASRNDILFGPKLGWMIPIYLATKDQDEFIYK